MTDTPPPDSAHPLVPAVGPGPAPAIAELRSVGANGPVTFTDEQWAFFFGEEPQPERKRNRWAGLVVAALVVGLLASSAFIAWRVVFDGRNDVRDPAEILAIAEQEVADSPHGWLVTGVEVVPILDIDIGGFVQNGPADGVVFIDRRPWDTEELASTVNHEIGHLLDFAAYANVPVARGGLESEVWAECAAVDAGFRDLDNEDSRAVYRCTPSNFSAYQSAISLLGEVCRPWADRECRDVGIDVRDEK